MGKRRKNEREGGGGEAEEERRSGRLNQCKISGASFAICKEDKKKIVSFNNSRKNTIVLKANLFTPLFIFNNFM